MREQEMHERFPVLGQKFAIREDCMNTRRARCETGIVRLKRRFAEQNAEIAKRDKDDLRWQVGLWTAFAFVLGFLIRTGGTMPGFP